MPKLNASKRRHTDPSLFGGATVVGRKHPLPEKRDAFHLQYEHPRGKLFVGESIQWLASLEDCSVDLIFADPPYNLKKADWDSFEDQEQYIEWSLSWIRQAARLLRPTGSMYVCGFSEILADLKHPSALFFKSCRWLVWHYKNKANLGADWGRSHESILHLRKTAKVSLNIDDVRIPYGAHTLKYPSHPQALSSTFGNGEQREEHWKPNPLGAKPKDVIDIPTTCNGMGEKTPHPTQKPEELVRKFVLASSKPGDVVLDPFSGSGTTVVAAEQLGRKWLGCDLSEQYNEWAIARLEHVRQLSVANWIQLDRQNALRRESIR